MEGYNPFSALNKLKGFHFILFNADLCLRILSQIRKKVANTFLGGSTQIITILHRRGHWNLLQYYKGGGSSRFLLQYYKGEGGSLGTPNLYYVIYGRPLNCFFIPTFEIEMFWFWLNLIKNVFWDPDRKISDFYDFPFKGRT